MNICEGCKKEFDFTKEAHGGCFAHHKTYCWDCTGIHTCVPGERCSLYFNTSPQWIDNLVKILHGSPKE